MKGKMKMMMENKRIRRRTMREEKSQILYFDIFYVDLDCTSENSTGVSFIHIYTHIYRYIFLSNFLWICLLFHITFMLASCIYRTCTYWFQPHDTLYIHFFITSPSSCIIFIILTNMFTYLCVYTWYALMH